MSKNDMSREMSGSFLMFSNSFSFDTYQWIKKNQVFKNPKNVVGVCFSICVEVPFNLLVSCQVCQQENFSFPILLSHFAIKEPKDFLTDVLQWRDQNTLFKKYLNTICNPFLVYCILWAIDPKISNWSDPKIYKNNRKMYPPPTPAKQRKILHSKAFILS